MQEKIDVLITAKEYIERLEKGIESIVYYIEIENEMEACRIISDATEGIQWLLDAIRLTEEVHNNQLATKDIEGFLAEIVEALENEDYILVGDLFNYEVLPQLSDIKNKMDMVIKG